MLILNCAFPLFVFFFFNIHFTFDVGHIDWSHILPTPRLVFDLDEEKNAHSPTNQYHVVHYNSSSEKNLFRHSANVYLEELHRIVSDFPFHFINHEPLRVRKGARTRKKKLTQMANNTKDSTFARNEQCFINTYKRTQVSKWWILLQCWSVLWTKKRTRYRRRFHFRSFFYIVLQLRFGHKK